MSVVGGWLLGPLVLALLSSGVGLLLAAVTRARVPGPLVPGLGLAGMIVLAGLATASDATAELAAPLCAVAAVTGFVLARPWRLERSPWPFVVAGGAFLLLAGPSLLSGQASVAGYIKLDDSAIWLGLIAHFMEHGRDISMVPPSTFQLDLLNWLDQGYPIGAFTPVGVTAKLSGQDYANVYQSVIASYGAIFALGLSWCVGGRARGAACALIGVQASLFAGYAQWGSIKEIAAAALIPIIAGLALRGHLLLAGVTAGALLDVLGIGGVLWGGAALAAGGVVLLLRRSFSVRGAAGALVAAAACAIPAWVVLERNADQTRNGAPTAQEDLGKLFEPLDILQGAGLWPVGDFRLAPDPRWFAVTLALLGLALAAIAVVLAVRRRQWALPAVVVATVAGAVPALVLGAPWIDAKVLAVTSPVLLTAAAAGALALRPRGAAAAAGVVLLTGCLASTWLIYRDVYITPRAELAELREMGEELEGEGPTLLLNYEGYATRYLLGPAQVEGATDLRHSFVPNRAGETFPNFTTVEVDDVDPQALYAFNTIARRRTPVGSWVPGGYRPVHEGRFFEAWQREGELPADHIGLGSAVAPAGPLPCARVRAAARKATTLVAAPRENPVVLDLAQAQLPQGWAQAAGVSPSTDGRATATVTVPSAGEWRVWVGGQTLGKLAVAVDGRSVGSLRHQLDASVGWLRYDAVALEPGEHTVTLDYERGWGAGRGSDTGQLPIGPLALSREQAPTTVRVPATEYRRLCDGRTYDWLDVLP